MKNLVVKIAVLALVISNVANAGVTGAKERDTKESRTGQERAGLGVQSEHMAVSNNLLKTVDRLLSAETKGRLGRALDNDVSFTSVVTREAGKGAKETIKLRDIVNSIGSKSNELKDKRDTLAKLVLENATLRRGAELNEAYDKLMIESADVVLSGKASDAEIQSFIDKQQLLLSKSNGSTADAAIAEVLNKEELKKLMECVRG